MKGSAAHWSQGRKRSERGGGESSFGMGSGKGSGKVFRQQEEPSITSYISKMLDAIF